MVYKNNGKNAKKNLFMKHIKNVKEELMSASLNNVVSNVFLTLHKLLHQKDKYFAIKR